MIAEPTMIVAADESAEKALRVIDAFIESLNGHDPAAHVAVRFTRCDADDRKIASYRAVCVAILPNLRRSLRFVAKEVLFHWAAGWRPHWVVTCVDGQRGIRAGSSFAP